MFETVRTTINAGYCSFYTDLSVASTAQYVACILTGNTVLMLEPDFPDRFDIMDETETEGPGEGSHYTMYKYFDCT